jgi:hypothetical protein
VMTRWRPGRKWFEANTPEARGDRREGRGHPRRSPPVLARNFG